MRFFAAFLLVLAVVHPGVCASQETPSPCDNPRNQQEINACAKEEYSKADATLNKTYRQLLAKLGNRQRVKMLKTAQSRWLAYRDAHCDFEAVEYSGGSMRPAVYLGCLTELTNARVEVLTRALNQL